jgi:hypothetical protein
MEIDEQEPTEKLSTESSHPRPRIRAPSDSEESVDNPELMHGPPPPPELVHGPPNRPSNFPAPPPDPKIPVLVGKKATQHVRRKSKARRAANVRRKSKASGDAQARRITIDAPLPVIQRVRVGPNSVERLPLVADSMSQRQLKRLGGKKNGNGEKKKFEKKREKPIITRMTPLNKITFPPNFSLSQSPPFISTIPPPGVSHPANFAGYHNRHPPIFPPPSHPSTSGYYGRGI